MKNTLSLLLFLGIVIPVFSQTETIQTDTSYSLKEVVVTGFQPNSPKSTSLNIEPYPLALMNQKAPYNLSDALAKLPGISQMTTGNSISKPVIRGLFGNRILVLLSGCRFDNQQWQDEHGLGLSQIGIDRVEVIKGPASLLYGSDALGGVINVVEEKPSAPGTKFDIGTQLFSNSLGTLTDAGISRKRDNHWWRVRLGYENHADYSDGANHRVLNSRNNGIYFKAGFGFDKKNWKQENSYHFSLNQYGFILEDLQSFFAPDARWTRQMNGPHHIVMLNLINSQNTIFLNSSLLKLNLGFQSNSRREDEGGGQISLNMHLISALENLKWEKDLSPHLTFVCNQQFTFENNKNYGGRIIIPDANMIENNLSGYLKYQADKVSVEFGAGVNQKFIQTFRTRTLNAPGETIQPFTKNNTTGNGMAGIVLNPSSFFTLKSNVSTGFRSPNLAELSSNGVHEGVYRYEIGDPDAKIEQNLNTDLSAEFHNKQFLLNASLFYNHFNNYVYLAPTADTYFGFPVFRFRQQNATLYGGELYASLHPKFMGDHQLIQSFAVTRGELADGSHLPYIPAYKSETALRFEKNIKLGKLFAELAYVYVFKQDRPAQFETETAAYYLLNLSSGITVINPKGNWIIGLNVTNLTNQKYADHLSRLKYYGLYNQGINFIVSVRKEIKW